MRETIGVAVAAAHGSSLQRQLPFLRADVHIRRIAGFGLDGQVGLGRAEQQNAMVLARPHEVDALLVTDVPRCGD